MLEDIVGHTLRALRFCILLRVPTVSVRLCLENSNRLTGRARAAGDT